MKSCLNDFLSYLSSEKGLSHNTLEAYERDVIRFLKSGLTVEGFLASLKDAGYKTSSLSRMLISIKVYYKYLKREGLIEVNEVAAIPGPKLWQKIPEILTQDEMERLLAAPHKKTFLEVRDKALFELMYASGLRVSELCSVKIHDVDDDFVKVKGKGSKERLVPIGKQALKAIDDWLVHYRDNFDSEKNPYLFITPKGKLLNRIEVWKRIKHWTREAGISKNITPHTMRHSFATHLLDHGADLRIIQEMLGHANIGSTDRYTHISKQGLRDSFQRHHPRP